MTGKRALWVIAAVGFCGCANLAPEEPAIRDAVLGTLARETAGNDVLGYGTPLIVGGPFTIGWSKDPDAWRRNRAQYDARHGIANAKVSVLGIRRLKVLRTGAWVVLDTMRAYEKDGRAMRARGIEAFALASMHGVWRMTNQAELDEGAVAKGPVAQAVLGSARAVVHYLNTDRVVPEWLTDRVVIEDDLQDWRGRGPGGGVQDPRMAPLMPGDPDLRIVLGRPLRLETGPSAAFVVFSATLRSAATGGLKGQGRLGLVLGGGNIMTPGIAPFGFEALAWAPT